MDAATRAGPLSHDDWTCLLVCEESGWICLTNDSALIRECGKVGVTCRRGLRLMLNLVHKGALTKRVAIQIVHRISTTNPHHIGAPIVSRFLQELEEDG